MKQLTDQIRSLSASLIEYHHGISKLKDKYTVGVHNEPRQKLLMHHAKNVRVDIHLSHPNLDEEFDVIEGDALEILDKARSVVDNGKKYLLALLNNDVKIKHVFNSHVPNPLSNFDKPDTDDNGTRKYVDTIVIKGDHGFIDTMKTDMDGKKIVCRTLSLATKEELIETIKILSELY